MIPSYSVQQRKGQNIIHTSPPCKKQEVHAKPRSYRTDKDHETAEWFGDKIDWGVWWVWGVLAALVLVVLVVGWLGSVTWPGTRERLVVIVTRCRCTKQS